MRRVGRDRLFARILASAAVAALVVSAAPAAAQEADSDQETASSKKTGETSTKTDKSDKYESLSEESDEENTVEKVKLAYGTTGSIHAQLGAGNVKLRRIMKKLESEPSVEEVQEAALNFYGLEHGTIEGYARQAKSKSIVPKVSVQYRKNLVGTQVEKFDYLRYQQDEPAALDKIDGDVDEFVVAGTWNLPKLIYNPEVLELASLRKTRERVLKEVTRLYYLRRRLKIGFMLNPPEDASTRARKQIRIDQTTAMINAMTDGIFEDDKVDD